MIRPATYADMDALLAMGRHFFAATGFADIVPFDDKSFRTTVGNLLSGDSVCLVAESGGAVVGAVGAMAYPFYFNHEHKTGQEIFWWLEPEYRGGQIGMQMFAALEEWARMAGCKSFSMIALDAVDAEKVGKIYRRCGYRASEHSYIKELK